MKKRGLFRKADQVVKGCNSDVFIIVHQKDTDKIFSYSSDPTFNLEKISSLVLRDVQQGQYLKKNMLYRETDFEKVKRNIEESGRLINLQLKQDKYNQAMSETPPDGSETPAHQLYDKNRMYDPNDGETATEDMSMSMQRTAEPSERMGHMYYTQKPQDAKYMAAGGKITSFHRQMEPGHSPKGNPGYYDHGISKMPSNAN